MDCGCAAPFVGSSLANTCGGGSFIFFMGLLDTFIRNKCDLSQVCSRVNPKTHPLTEYDFVVIGGGSSGAVVAGRLSEIPNWRVLLIEAGNDEPVGSQVPSMVTNFHSNPNTDWNYKTEPDPNYSCLGYPNGRCSWPRAKILGGCSVINGMMYMRGSPEDYNRWAADGNYGWSYEDVLPTFIKSEDNLEIGSLVDKRYHGIGGPLTTKKFNHQPELAYDILKGAKELGYPVVEDLNGVNYAGFTIAQSNTRNGSRLSSARAYLRPARDRPNLHVMLNSTATKLIIDKSTKQVIGVEFRYKNMPMRVNVKKEVIVSGGAINSPQLLLLSGIGPKEELDKVGIQQVHNLPGVGKNLHNHVTFYLTYQLKNLDDINDLDWVSAMDYLVNRKGPMSSTGMSQVTARINSRYADRSFTYPDLQIFFGGFSADCAESCTPNSVRDSKNPTAPKTLTISPVVLHPKSRGKIGLKSNNPLDSPLMYPNYLHEPQDIATLIEGIRVIQRLTNTSVLKQKYGIILDQEDYGDCNKLYRYDSDQFWECAVRLFTGPENHQAGSCKMGPEDDPMAVVDPELQVHGMPNLRVMDASIMPTLVSGNTHATCVMIAEKGVEMIKDDWLYSKKKLENRNNDEIVTGKDPTPILQSRYSDTFEHDPDFHRANPHIPNPFMGNSNNVKY